MPLLAPALLAASYSTLPLWPELRQDCSGLLQEALGRESLVALWVTEEVSTSPYSHRLWRKQMSVMKPGSELALQCGEDAT